MSEHTHESDKKLWLDAHHHAPFFTLKPGEMLTPEQRERAYDLIAENEEQEHKERMQMKCY